MKKETTMLEQIIDYCSKNGITSYELAKHLPLSQVALHGILSGSTTRPRIKNVKLIYDYLLKNENISNVVNEPAAVYETGFDKKITDAEKRIKELEQKLKSNDPDLTPLAIEMIKKIIESLYKEISIHQEAKNDYLKHNK